MLLSVNNLSIGFNKLKPVTRNISFNVDRGEILGIVGESGSGKSITSLAVMGLNAVTEQIFSGSIEFDNKILLKSEAAYYDRTKKSNRNMIEKLSRIPESELRKLRGNEISMIFQEPMTSLNPVITIENQMKEILNIHTKMNKEERKKRVCEMLIQAGLENPEELCKKYPHQLSGGMRQRVMIAMAMLLKPKLLIADEPTTALDVSLQDKILKLLKKFNKEYNTSIILISHDLGVIKSICDRAIVMNNGEIEEQGSISDIFINPKKEYTKKLLKAAMGGTAKYEISPFDYEKCSKAVLEVNKLGVYYEEKKSNTGFELFSRNIKRQVVYDASFKLYEGEILGIVGESGSGKSSIIKAVCGLNKLYDGKVQFIENDVMPQMVFQDPYASLNPSKKVGWLLEEALRLGDKTKNVETKTKISVKKQKDYSKKVYEMLINTGLGNENEVHLFAEKYPNELSGGQRQRVAIAMALMQNRKIVFLDEPVSALDVTIQEQILEMLLKLRESFGLSYVFVSHDMNVIKRICDRVCVMYKGYIVEENTTKEIFENPKHEYTKRLMKLSNVKN